MSLWYFQVITCHHVFLLNNMKWQVRELIKVSCLHRGKYSKFSKWADGWLSPEKSARSDALTSDWNLVYISLSPFLFFFSSEHERPVFTLWRIMMVFKSPCSLFFLLNSESWFTDSHNNLMVFRILPQRPIIRTWNHQEREYVHYASYTEIWKHINHFRKHSIKITKKLF